jgi:hypothetical protein
MANEKPKELNYPDYMKRLEPLADEVRKAKPSFAPNPMTGPILRELDRLERAGKRLLDIQHGRV